MLLISDTLYKKRPSSSVPINSKKTLYFIVLIKCFEMWHSSCIIITSGSFTFLCQPLRDALHKLRMTHKQVPAVQLLITALLYQSSGETSSKAPPHFLIKPGSRSLALLYSSSFVLQVRWPHLFTPVTYLLKLPGFTGLLPSCSVKY